MKPGKIIIKIFTVLFLIFIAAIIFRIFMMTNSRTLSDIYPTAAAAAAYKEKGSGAFLTHKCAGEISSDGYYGAYGLVYCPDTEELQLTARFNDSLHEKYLDNTDPKYYKWELRDSDGDTVAEGTVLDTAEKYQYNYMRIAFDGVKIEDDTALSLFLICEEREYPEEDTEGMKIHSPTQTFKNYKLSKDEIDALEK